MSNYDEARKEVAKLINIELRAITYVLYKKGIEESYKSFEIPKKAGGTRVIDSPNKQLKRIQTQLGKKVYDIHKNYIDQKRIASNISHGFETGKSIITNARIHKNKKYLLNIDIANFFSSINFGRVQGYFNKSQEFMFSKEVSTIISQLVCYEKKLPQGAPTSPIISNLIFNIVDLRILSLAKKYKLSYTRYADDMSFSTNNKAFRTDHIEFIQELKVLLKNSGFDINESKTRLEYYSSRQEVTGLTVNKKINARRKFIKQTRAMVDQLFKTDSFKIDGVIGTEEQLEGRLAFINQLDWYNNDLESESKKNKGNKKYISGLNAREKQYQYFLFYKYFFRPSKPTIVTEGKTDIIHIKAALMKYSDRYPNLITKNDSGKYVFNLYFLNKSKRLKYFLGIVQNGADTMKNIWNFYNGKNNCDNIFKYINDKSEYGVIRAVNPVILLFDNEKHSDKPLRKFLKHIGMNAESDKPFLKLNANLYLQKIPRVNNSDSEIEDLYSKEILNISINGKKFEKIVKDEDTFSKDIFSKYILEHYQEIDFSNFLPLLDSINNICKIG
ncbi:MAG: retron Ec67 family RNA-directed DNA polymerase/endonuclease [Veillonella sp.]|nr:retron Ec67 family RNA-directed DNA polymerase/endonuclease [Veillonella sp.]MBS6725114.1 retron Ec67 family RNA-directed DNA polymerase/endonuclease [Veillonella sp.]MDU5646220.1 retron Ec67 family RNA-directed DNA polymerase/endonuclease [Veillonella sp.]MDU6632891.1 retron Ec67 family RNA-directed DNA polymerase/endonuclease [Veillonella sp.]